MGLFGFLSDMENYEQRQVDRYDDPAARMIIDTCRCSDGEKPFETAVCHPLYNDGKWAIVEAYDSKEEAQKGHTKWVSIMTAKDLPNVLADCCNAQIGQLAKAFGMDVEYKKDRW